MSFPTTACHRTIARTALGYILFIQVVMAIVFAGAGALYASTYLFESDHSGWLDGIQVPIGLAATAIGIFATTILLLTRAHLRRDGAQAGLVVCLIELCPLYLTWQVVDNVPATVLRLSVWAALACVVVDAGWRLSSRLRSA